MSLLNQFRANPVDVENPARIKQINAPGIQRSEKKKALADVKNIIHQKTPQSSAKLNKTMKLTSFGGENLLNYNAKKNDIKKDEDMSKDYYGMFAPHLTVEKEDNFIHRHTCKCDEIFHYDDMNMLFEGLKLSNSEIENFALDWENEPVFTSENKRRLFSDEDWKPINISFDNEDPLELLLQTIPEMEIPKKVKVPRPSFLYYKEEE